jgi:phage protein D/phage baseplate assembly protein gpV
VPKTEEQVYISVGGKQLEVAASELLSVRIEQALDLPDMAFISIVAAREWVEEGTFNVGKEVKLDLQQGPRRLNIFGGDIAGVEPRFKANGSTELTVRCFDPSHLMTRGRKSKTYQQVKDSDIAQRIAQEYGWGTDIEPTQIVYDHVYQHNQSDLEFLHLRAARIGYQVGVNDKKLYFKKMGQPIRPGASSATIELEIPNTLGSFSGRLSSAAQPKKVIVRGWDLNTKQEIIGEASQSDSVPETEMGKGGGSAAGAFNTDAELSVDTQVFNQKEAEILAKAKLDSLTTSYLMAEGTTEGNPALQPGAKVKVSGSGRFDGTYIVADARHTFTRSGYQTSFKVGHGDPKSSGGTGRGGGGATMSIGIVTDNEDPQGIGRVKVKLPMLAADVQSDWARILTPSAGKERGFYWLPEVGDEVLVGFEQGTHSAPIVLGCLWNGQDGPPKPNADVKDGSDVAKRMMKSRSGHIIQFDDTRGDEKVEIEDKTGNKIVFYCKDDKIIIESHGDIELKAGQGIKLSARMGVEIEAGTSASLKAGTRAEVNGSAGVTLEGGPSVAVNAAMVNLKNGAMTVV